VGFDDCLNVLFDPAWGVDAEYCGLVSTRWRVRVKSDSYNGTGHEHWQIESDFHPGKCVIAGNSNGGLLTLGSCQYSGSIHNKFEVFKSVIDGNNNVYQLKDTEAWENNGQHRCIVRTRWSTEPPEMGSCNVRNSERSSYWDAISW
jgi:hypothetical protein